MLQSKKSSRPLAVGRIIAPSRRSKAPNDWGRRKPHETSDLPWAGGRTGTVNPSSPTLKGSINQEASSVRGSLGALPLRPTAMIRQTSHEVLLYGSAYYASGITAFDGWICRVGVIRVGADLRVRPQGIQRSNEDGRTHRSAPTRQGLAIVAPICASFGEMECECFFCTFVACIHF